VFTFHWHAKKDKMNYDLVFEGGGAKGMVFVGALEIFEEEGHTIGRLLGTSAGAITATLLAAGYSPKEMLEALVEKVDGKSVFTTFMANPKDVDPDAFQHSDLSLLLLNLDVPYLPMFIEKWLDEVIFSELAKSKYGPNLYSLFEQGGWFTAEYFLDWLKRKLDEGNYNNKPRNFSKLTLSQFYNITKTDLSLVASNTSAHQILVLNHRTAPDCPVVWAVRMSMSLPMVWPEVIWQPEWGTYQGIKIEGDAVVDGGLLSNFPIELFISRDKVVQELMGIPKQDSAVIGLLIDETRSVSKETGEPKQPKSQQPSVTDVLLVKRLLNLIDTVTQAHDKMVMDANQNLVVRLPAAGYGTTEFDMDEQKRNSLVEAGKRAMQEFFSTQSQRGEAESGESFDFSVPPGKATPQSTDRIASNLLKFKKR